MIIHRDISSGNILIRPVFLLGNDGHIRVEWVGILTDWELSKPIVPPGSGTARQPERTVSSYHERCELEADDICLGNIPVHVRCVSLRPLSRHQCSG